MRRMEKVETKFAFDFRAFARIRSFLFVFDRTISAAVFFNGLKKKLQNCQFFIQFIFSLRIG